MDSPNTGQGGALVKSEGGAVTAGLFKTGNPEIDRLPISTQVWFNDELYERVTKAATIMSKAEGFVSQDLLGKTETCFAVVLTAFDAGLSPFEVARGAYQTPEGKVGYETRVIQSIVEAKGFFSKPPKLDYSGPWERLIGKFEKKQNERTKKWYTAKTWTAADAKGCKLRVTFYFRDLAEPVECEEMDLAEVGTHFSTQWATEPKAQFARLVVRRQLQLKRPSILAGVPCIDDLLEQEQPMKEINPRAEKSGDAGLDEFAAGETVVDDDAGKGEPDSQSETVDSKPAETKTDAGDKAPGQDSDTSKPDTQPAEGAIKLWISADEPAREIASLSNASHVLKCAIEDAPTPAAARAILNQNMDVIGRMPDTATRRIEKAVEAKEGGDKLL